MSFLNNVYHNSLAENEKNILFWEDYLTNLNALDFSAFADKLKVPALVPIGSRIFFKGELIHTNEVMVSLGADYFAKCSLTQAEVLRQHRIKNAQSKLDTFKREREYLENRLSFRTQNVFEDEVQEIVENYSEDEEIIWKRKHGENVKKYKQSKTTEKDVEVKITDEELWNRLEELELQEELDNELLSTRQEKEDSESLDSSADSFIIKEDDTSEEHKDTKEVKVTDDDRSSKQTFKLDMLQKVLDKQNELEEKLVELRNKDRSKSKTENDLISRLNEMEELDELEDEMDRINDILETEDVESEEESSTACNTKLKRRVSFVDDDESETLELTFSHSDIEPCTEPYKAENGILKPSDIYEAYSNLFTGETTSILKKTKYSTAYSGSIEKDKKPKAVSFEEIDNKDVQVNETIVVKDVVERDQRSNKLEMGARPTSLFKKRRQQMKS